MDVNVWKVVLITSVVLIVFIIVILLIVYLFNQKSVSAQKKHFAKLHKDLKVGRKVIVLNGIYGEVSRVDEETIDLKIKTGQIMEVSRFAVSEILEK